MAFVTAGAALLSGILGAAASSAGSARSNAAQQEANAISREQLEASKKNAVQQQIMQALINQRAVAGSKDSYGSSMRYDPSTNTWISELGALPQAADRAAMQQSIQANTTDPARVRLANQVALRRAADAGNYADQTRRDLENYRPMGQDQLVGLLTNQATTAARESYDPLRNDVLRATYRTGTAAGPVVSSIGESEARNLRNSLRDSLITGMTQTDSINNSRRSALENAAANASTLATPNLQSTGGANSTQGNALATLLQQRSTNAPQSTALGSAGVNQAMQNANTGYDALRKNLVDPNFGLNQSIAGLKDLSTFFGKGGAGSDALKALFGGSSESGKGYSDTEREAAAGWS